mmetsp:Transcript_70336/g.185660  ORF Transcript_70336/g.185660 Transcript_70336/m.185660 type:complete len:241 (-) Transcript_70336:40-762(-)
MRHAGLPTHLLGACSEGRYSHVRCRRWPCNWCAGVGRRRPWRERGLQLRSMRRHRMRRRGRPSRIGRRRASVAPEPSRYALSAAELVLAHLRLYRLDALELPFPSGALGLSRALDGVEVPCWMEANRRSTSAQSSSMRISNARREARASASPAMSRSSSSTESFVSSSFHAAASFGCATLACRPTCSARAARAAILMFGVGAGLATGAPVWGGGVPGGSVDCSCAACGGTECGGAAGPPG